MSASFHCDRCGASITTDRTVINAESGSLIYTLSNLDLCGPCAESLGRWFRQPAAERADQARPPAASDREHRAG